MQSNVDYVPLWVKSHYSFLEGASSPEELVERAHKLGLKALAITDRNGFYGAVRAHTCARKLGIKLILGVEIRIAKGLHARSASPAVLLAKNKDGYAFLCKLLTKAHHRILGEKKTSKSDSHERLRIFFSDLEGHAHNICALATNPQTLKDFKKVLDEDLWALHTQSFQEDDEACSSELHRVAKALGIKETACVEVLYHQEDRKALQDVLRCIRHKCTLHEAGTRISVNACQHLPSTEEMQLRFSGREDLCAATQQIADSCTFTLDDIRYRYPEEASRQTQSKLAHLTWEGARKRFGNKMPEEVCTQIQRELKIIEDLAYGGYFLTMHEIVNFCQDHGILCQGRGSAANSIVCYALGITAVDPIRLSLLFERFLSRERAEPPDIDLDIEHGRREEVIQYMYRRYGRDHAAMVANVVRYRPKSAIRDVGKALGIPATKLDGLSKLFSSYETQMESSTGGLSRDQLQNTGFDPEAQSTAWLFHLAKQLLNTPRHLSIHPGGFLLGEEPVHTLVPIEPATMEGRTVIQWDKQDIEDLGLFKVDLLGLGALSCIKHCFELFEKHKLSPVQKIASIPAGDQETYNMICRGDTVGVFQIESRAQMTMLPRLKPQKFYDLVIEVAIVRPGPIQGDMVHPYLRRRQGLEKIEYPHPCLRRILEKTCGVPIFQEQVMRIAVEAAGYSAGEADQLRRDMAAWSSSGRIEKHYERFVSRMQEQGISRKFAERVFSQIRGFGEYGFPESHAASFALLAYSTSWLKCHHPEVFLCAMLNAQPMGFYSPSTLIKDAERHGVRVLPVDAQKSEWDCTLETVSDKRRCKGTLSLGSLDPGDLAQYGNTIGVRIGFRYIKGLARQEAEKVIAFHRGEQGGFSHPMLPGLERLEKFASRVPLRKDSWIRLAESGALRSYNLSRREALWHVRELAKNANDRIWISGSTQRITSEIAHKTLSHEESIVWDYETSSLSTEGHPMELLRPHLEAYRAKKIVNASRIADVVDKSFVHYVGTVICRQRPQTASGACFFTLEDETGFVNVVLWRTTFTRYTYLAKAASYLGVSGELQVADGNVRHLIAKKLWDPLPIIGTKEGQQRTTLKSRDFH